MMPSINSIGNYFNKKSKSKTPEPCRQYPSGQSVNCIAQPSPVCAYQHHPHPHLQTQAPYHQTHHVYPPHHQHPIHVPLSPYPLQCQTQHIIQSPQHIQSEQHIQSPQQSVAWPMQNQIRSNMMDPRPPDSMMMSNQIHVQSTQFVASPPYQVNQTVQSGPISSQSPRYVDNSYYSNQAVNPGLQQELQQQQQINQQQQLQHQSSQQQLDEQRQRAHKQQFRQQQSQQQVQPREQTMDFKLPPQQHQHQPTQMQQQQYQNHQMMNEATNGDLLTETLCIMHEKGKEELANLASSLQADLNNLKAELDIIRRETPVYSVSEAKI